MNQWDMCFYLFCDFLWRLLTWMMGWCAWEFKHFFYKDLIGQGYSIVQWFNVARCWTNDGVHGFSLKRKEAMDRFEYEHDKIFIFNSQRTFSASNK